MPLANQHMLFMLIIISSRIGFFSAVQELEQEKSAHQNSDLTRQNMISRLIIVSSRNSMSIKIKNTVQGLNQQSAFKQPLR